MTTSEPSATPAKPRRGKQSPADPAAPVPPVETAEVAAVSAEPPAAVGGAPETAVPAGGPAPGPPVPEAPVPEATATEPVTVDGARRTKTLHLPYVTAIVEVPRVPSVPRPRLPRVGRREVAEAAGAVTALLPPPSRLLFYAGVGALAAFEVIEWPVAAVVAAGTYVAGRTREQDRAVVPGTRESTRPVEPALA
jgi:hypothetical protein